MDEVSSPPARPVEKACEEPALRARGGGGSGQEGFRNRRLLSERQPARPRAAGRGAGELLRSARRRRPGAGLDRACLRGTPHPRRLPRLLRRIRRRFPSRRQGRAQRLPPSGRSREKGRSFWAIPGSLYEQTSPRHSRGLSLCKKTRAVPRKGRPAFCGCCKQQPQAVPVGKRKSGSDTWKKTSYAETSTGNTERTKNYQYG